MSLVSLLSVGDTRTNSSRLLARLKFLLPILIDANFIGYLDHQSAYVCVDANRHMYETCNVVFVKGGKNSVPE